jgi:hypothetical protein
VGVGGEVGVGVGRGRGRGWVLGRGVGAGGGDGASAGAGPVVTGVGVEARGDGEGLERGSRIGSGSLDADASERRAAQVTRPQNAVGARGCRTGWCSMTTAPATPRTISPAAAHGATYRARQVRRESGRPLSGGPVAPGGSFAPLAGPVDIRSPPWTAKCYQNDTAITIIMSAKEIGPVRAARAISACILSTGGGTIEYADQKAAGAGRPAATPSIGAAQLAATAAARSALRPRGRSSRPTAAGHTP